MKRLFWLGLGVVTGVVTGVAVTRKATKAAQRFTPASVGEQPGEGRPGLAAALEAFRADVRAGMAERENQLSGLVERQIGRPLPGVIEAALLAPDAVPDASPASRRARGAEGQV